MDTAWWVADLHPISGELRAVFYSGLLLLCVFDHPSPLHSAAIIARTERAFYTPVGLMRALGLCWVTPKALRIVTSLTVVAWIAVIVGLLQPITAILTFLGFAFLHGVNAGALGSNHSTHAALYALFCLSFSVSDDACSLDYYLFSHGHWPLLLRASPVFESGFAPKLTLVFLAYCMFAGGVAKLRNGGLKWLNGDAIRFYIRESAEYARWPALARVLVEHPALCRCLAWFTVVVEICAILVLWDTPFRLPLVLAWTSLHVGILLVMMPAYWVQMWCYTLVIDWHSIITVPTRRDPGDAVNVLAGAPFGRGELGATVLSVFGYLVCLGLAAILWRQSESWPFTSVPMYSNSVPPQAELPPTRDELQIRAKRSCNGDVGAWKRAWMSSEAWEDIWIVRPEDHSPKSLLEVLEKRSGATLIRWSQFAKVVRTVVISDVVAKPAGHLEFDATDAEYPGTHFLRTVAAFVKRELPDWRQYQRLDLVVCTDSGWIVVGRADI